MPGQSPLICFQSHHLGVGALEQGSSSAFPWPHCRAAVLLADLLQTSQVCAVNDSLHSYHSSLLSQ